jgi:membrane peptidoglycan carboxypeptidase
MTMHKQASESVPAVPLPRAPGRKRSRASSRGKGKRTEAGSGKAPAKRSSQSAKRARQQARARQRKRAQYPLALEWSLVVSPRPHRLWRLLRVSVRRAVGVTASLGVLGTIALTGLLMVTPSVSNASARARALDRTHHVSYPGPPVPARFAASLISTEDHRFYSEPGIDPIAVARVIVGRLTGQPDQGGATLYAQLAKMLYTRGRSGIFSQPEEVLLGIKLDLSYAKPRILQMYSDVAYFGHGYYGLSAASCGYFGVPPSALTWPQAALLAGLVQAPSADDPLKHLVNAKARQAHVLGRLVATGKLSLVQAQWAYRKPLHLIRGPVTGCLSHALNSP